MTRLGMWQHPVTCLAAHIVSSVRKIRTAGPDHHLFVSRLGVKYWWCRATLAPGVRMNAKMQPRQGISDADYSRDERDEGFIAFMQEAQPGLLRAAFFLTGSQEAAHELTQDALVRTYLVWSKVRPDTAYAYARRILVNQRVERPARRGTTTHRRTSVMRGCRDPGGRLRASKVPGRHESSCGRGPRYRSTSIDEDLRSARCAMASPRERPRSRELHDRDHHQYPHACGAQLRRLRRAPRDRRGPGRGRDHRDVRHPGAHPPGRAGRRRPHRSGRPAPARPWASACRCSTAPRRRCDARADAHAGVPQALVVVPTRELGVQVASDLAAAGKRRGIRVLPSTAGARTSRRSRRCATVSRSSSGRRVASSTWRSRAT